MATTTRKRLVSTEHVEQHFTTTGRTTCQPSSSTLKRLGSDNENVNNKGWCFPEKSVGDIVLKLAVACAAGMVFGWALEKGRVFEPAQIRLQMVFHRFVMLKMFLTATSVGQLSMALLSVLPGTSDRFKKAVSNYACCLNLKGVFSSSIGPFILGAGMTLSGSCPGMVLAQVGSQATNAGSSIGPFILGAGMTLSGSIFPEYTLLGALIGSLLFGLFAAPIIKRTKPSQPHQQHSVPQYFGVPYSVVAVPMALLLLGAVYMVESLIPWEQDLDCWNRNSIATPNSTTVLSLKSWPPYVSGSLIGLLQLPIVLVFTDTVGGSTSYVTMVSQWVVTEKLQKTFPYLASARCGIGNWWQVFFVCAAVVGGALSATLSGSLGSAQGVPASSALIGGFLLMLGARIAGGCTSGLGLSGMGLLYWLSFVAVPAMFAGGITLAVIMHATGSLLSFECPEGLGACPSIPTTHC